MATTLNVRARQHDTLDLLCQRHLGRTAGHVEATLGANPGLARIGPVLPMGHPVTLVASPSAKNKQMVYLWE